ncbi:amidohydrolase family protein [Nocardioides lianchengensis]|uniref:Cytosine/adenosine deaminase n=1 Tax=Nocardioides lianchengensis TaxID=1045774 RepID=A0A1G6TM95_9ACTN|nr:amidohydrolase family protein [Nocardioides lianchengensis]NYG11723.1 cytosine/adenosine deaminase-related metal-dependent hydrolase [Nocardioides lianchengensis]SDD29626.1 Cytosine/adenosine deaminase [Nocardioides lianchengensis]
MPGPSPSDNVSDAAETAYDGCGHPVPAPRVSRRALFAGAGATAAVVPLAMRVPHADAESAPAKRVRPANEIGRGHYLIKNAALVSVDPEIGNQQDVDIEVKDGVILRIGSRLTAAGAEQIDASAMIVMPGFIETHYHMWSALGRNFVGDGFEYFPAKSATVAAYEPRDFYNSVLLGLAEAASAGITTVHNWAHNVRAPEYADAELRAHRDAAVRARYSYGHRDGQPATQLIDIADIDRVRTQWFGSSSPFEDVVHLGVNVRGPSNMTTFQAEMALLTERGIPVSVHSGQGPTTAVKPADLETQGYLGPDFLVCHNLPATQADRDAMKRTGAPVSFAPHSELRLGTAGGYHGQLLRSKADGLIISLSFDASSLAPINMFESMNLTWNLGIPYIGTDTASLAPVLLKDVIEWATLGGARALGIDDVTGSITPGKRADIIMIRQDDLNMAPACDVESAIVRVATPANVDTVMVDGRVLKRGGKLVGFDTQRIVRNAASSAHAVRTRAGGRLKPASVKVPTF